MSRFSVRSMFLLHCLLLMVPLVAAGCQEAPPVDKVTEQQQMEELNQARDREWNNK